MFTHLWEKGMIRTTASIHPLARTGRDGAIGARATICKETTIGGRGITGDDVNVSGLEFLAFNHNSSAPIASDGNVAD